MSSLAIWNLSSFLNHSGITIRTLRAWKLVQPLLFLVTTALEIMLFTCLTGEKYSKHSWSTDRQDQGGGRELWEGRCPVDNRKERFREEKGPVSWNWDGVKITYQGKTEWQQVREKRKVLWEGWGPPTPHCSLESMELCDHIQLLLLPPRTFSFLLLLDFNR